ncbi:protein slit-like [Ylistrum balloti]|uniref:protein slit-like n=1 Tax=Ylistrum balloti TaxID=509963 RepID=UPI002905CE71|nr:protein slit-like [Ylistrum balloti]
MKKKTSDGCWLVLMALVGLAVQNVSSSVNCPNLCQCVVGDSEAFIVDCVNQKLTTFPESVPVISTKLNISSNTITRLIELKQGNILFSSVTVLDISNNVLEEISADFLKAFPNLEYLYLKQNKLREIPDFLPETMVVLHAGINMITSLCNLTRSPVRELYLSNNNINLGSKSLSEQMERTCSTTFEFPNLEVLDLAGNQITNIDDETFSRSPKLRHLSLSKNRIANVSFVKELNAVEVLDLSNNLISGYEKHVFENLSKLRYLSLAFNNFISLPGYFPTLEWLDMSFNSISHLVEDIDKDGLYPHDVFLLGGNPFHCDCHLQWVKDLYDLRIYLLKYIDVKMEKYVPVCATPNHLAGKSWDLLDTEQFVCSDKIRSPAKMAETANKDYHWSPELHTNFVGQTYIKLSWAPIKVDLKSKLRETILTYRKFGGRNEWIEVLVTGNMGVYTIRDLNPNTAYVICLKGDVSLDHSCVEVVTSGQFWLQQYVFFGWMAALVFICIVAILIMCFCFFKNDSLKKQQ